ncbi:MAG: hypothetical protein PHE27_03275 [Alphaproteobacteria bacterium]|nr:hypothetical protein [Alphaproteobacteria bacterium]
MSASQALYPHVAAVVCDPFEALCPLDGLETPHGHPEPPTDFILFDFFAPNCPKPR